MRPPPMTPTLVCSYISRYRTYPFHQALNRNTLYINQLSFSIDGSQSMTTISDSMTGGVFWMQVTQVVNVCLYRGFTCIEFLDFSNDKMCKSEEPISQCKK